MKCQPTKTTQVLPPLQGNPRRTRLEHSQEIALDYVELIAELIATTGAARVTDLAPSSASSVPDWSTPARIAPFCSPKPDGNCLKNHVGVTRLWSRSSSRSVFRTP
jgi:hypothetical protein